MLSMQLMFGSIQIDDKNLSLLFFLGGVGGRGGGGGGRGRKQDQFFSQLTKALPCCKEASWLLGPLGLSAHTFPHLDIYKY